ncbi:MAG: TrkA family potassium uptake protein [Clostridiales bacterium]|nr:TrkA family potassium uptake protein [Clostridiales bacterium]
MQIVVLGTSTDAIILARRLSKNHDVVLIDEDASDKASYHKLDVQAVDGVIIDTSILEEAGVRDADVVCALSEKENTNLVAAQIARNKFGVKKVIACTYDTEEFQMFEDVGVCPISATDLTVDAFIMAMHDNDEKPENRIGVSMVNLFGDNFKFKVFRIEEDLNGTKLKNISDTEGGLILGVMRDGTLHNYDPNFKVALFDKLILAEVYE